MLGIASKYIEFNLQNCFFIAIPIEEYIIKFKNTAIMKVAIFFFEFSWTTVFLLAFNWNVDFGQPKFIFAFFIADDGQIQLRFSIQLIPFRFKATKFRYYSKI